MDNTTKTTHECPVVEIVLTKHENADSLSVVVIENYTQVVVNTAQWQGKNRGVYIPPQNYVDVRRPEFAFLKKKEGQEWHLVKGCKLRGVLSNGLLIPVDNDVSLGENWTERLGVLHKEDEPEEQSNECVGGPSGWTLSKYDIDGPKNFLREFVDGEEVVITEKCHGQSSRFLYYDGQMYVGTRNQWIKQNDSAPVWKAFKKNPQILSFCQDNTDKVLYGEVFAFQKNYDYGFHKNDSQFLAFDIRLKNGYFIDYDEFINYTQKYNIPTVPLLYRGPWSHSKVLEMASGPSLIGGKSPREGCVCKPAKERQSRKFERMIYKVISENFCG